MRDKKIILLGYRARGIQLYKTDIKPLGYVVGAIGAGALVIAAIPNGLGIVFYPISAFCFGLIGINIFVKKKEIQNKIAYKIKYMKMRVFK